MKRIGFIGVVGLLWGCTEKNPLYCDRDGDCQSGSCDRKVHTCSVTLGDGGPDGPLTHCLGDPECPAAEPHCVEGICRQCATAMDCGGGLCLSDHSCGPCAQDNDCNFAGGVCVRGICPPAD